MGGQRGRGGKTKKALIRYHLMLSKAVKNQTKRLSQFRLGIVLSLGGTLALFFSQVENELCEVTEGVRTDGGVSLAYRDARTGPEGTQRSGSC